MPFGPSLRHLVGRGPKVGFSGHHSGKPLKFGGTQRQPIGEGTHGFDDGKVPALSGRNGLHALRFGEPFGD